MPVDKERDRERKRRETEINTYIYDVVISALQEDCPMDSKQQMLKSYILRLFPEVIDEFSFWWECLVSFRPITLIELIEYEYQCLISFKTF